MNEKSLNVVPLTQDLLPFAESFSSGNKYIDGFLKNGDFSLDVNIGTTYVFLSSSKKEIVGFYNLGMGSLDQLQEVNGRLIRSRMGERLILITSL